MAVTKVDLRETAVAELLANNGLEVAAEDVAAITRAVERIEQAAERLPKPGFDDTVEQYYRLLEQHVGGGNV